MINLNEGLRKGDLDGMILPMISIDEFDSKIDNESVVVVAFFCQEEDPAHDLSNFIERSPINVLDTEVSPAPNKEGYYLTFVEMKRNKLFAEYLIKLIDEINNLTDVHEWQFTSYKLPKGKIVELTEENLNEYVDTHTKPDNRTDQLKEFFAHSSLSDFVFEQSHVYLRRAGVQHEYKLVDLLETAPVTAISFDEHMISQAIRLGRLLDGDYVVHAVTEGLLVENTQLGTYLLLSND
jgi:hypothetical protein